MANGYSMMSVPSGMGMTGGAMPAPLATFLSNLPLSNAPTIAVNESTPNLDRIQNFPVVSRNGVFHIHQDPATGQRYSMTDEFHGRIMSIVSINQTNTDIINTSNLSEFYDTYSTGKRLSIDIAIKNFLDPIFENQLETRIFENDISSKRTYSKIFPIYKNVIQNAYTTLFNTIPKNVLRGNVSVNDINMTGGVMVNPISMTQDINYGNGVIVKVQPYYGVPVNTFYVSRVANTQQSVQSSVVSFQNLPINTYQKSG